MHHKSVKLTYVNAPQARQEISRMQARAQNMQPRPSKIWVDAKELKSSYGNKNKETLLFSVHPRYGNLN